MQDKKNKYELKYVDGKVELDERLLIMSLLDDLFRKGLINVATYKRAIERCEKEYKGVVVAYWWKERDGGGIIGRG